jgi:hypothetical protein
MAWRQSTMYTAKACAELRPKDDFVVGPEVPRESAIPD